MTDENSQCNTLLVPLGAGEMIRDHQYVSTFYVGMRQRAMFIVLIAGEKVEHCVCDYLCNTAVVKGWVSLHTI